MDIPRHWRGQNKRYWSNNEQNQEKPCPSCDAKKFFSRPGRCPTCNQEEAFSNEERKILPPEVFQPEDQFKKIKAQAFLYLASESA